jgi:hypothetical protein
MQVTIFNGTTWSKPTQVAGSLYSAPSCAEYTGGEVLCAARNSTGGLAWTVFNGTTWSAFANLTTTAISAPSCTTDNNGGVICAIFTSAYVTLVNRYSAGKWEGFLNLAGTAGGEPDCTSMNSGGQVVCFAKAYYSQIFVTLFNGGSWAVGNWASYLSLGGSPNDNAGCTTQATGQLVCGAISALDSAFYADVYNGSIWLGWNKIGGAGVGSPSCATLGTGQVVCVMMGPNNKLTSVVGP